MTELKATEIQLTRLSLNPGEVLAVKVTSSEVTQADLVVLEDQMKLLFPNNRVMLFCMSPGDTISFEAIKGSEPAPAQFCSDCNCGKKESRFSTLEALADIDEIIKQGESQ